MARCILELKWAAFLQQLWKYRQWIGEIKKIFIVVIGSFLINVLRCCVKRLQLFSKLCLNLSQSAQLPITQLATLPRVNNRKSITHARTIPIGSESHHVSNFLEDTSSPMHRGRKPISGMFDNDTCMGIAAFVFTYARNGVCACTSAD